MDPSLSRILNSSELLITDPKFETQLTQHDLTPTPAPMMQPYMPQQAMPINFIPGGWMPHMQPAPSLETIKYFDQTIPISNLDNIELKYNLNTDEVIPEEDETQHSRPNSPMMSA